MTLLGDSLMCGMFDLVLQVNVYKTLMHFSSYKMHIFPPKKRGAKPVRHIGQGLAGGWQLGSGGGKINVLPGWRWRNLQLLPPAF